MNSSTQHIQSRSPNVSQGVGCGLGLATPSDYITLMKPRVMSLVVFTAMVGLVCAPVSMSPLQAIASIFFIATGAGASGALNMWYDRDIDQIMKRTRKRPLPLGIMPPSAALAFGIFLSVFSVIGLAMASNYYAAGLLAFTILFYVIVYTHWLKRSTPQNIVIGGAAGAFPPMVGWAAASGGTIGDPIDMSLITQVFAPESIALFLLIFLWTPPHFWALALYKQMDYGTAGVPMMPNVKGAKSTRRQMLFYAVLLAMTSAYIGTTSLASSVYWVGAGVLNLGFVALTAKVWLSKAGEKIEDGDSASLYAVKSGDLAARNLFAYSIVYLFAMFALIAISKLMQVVI